ncbi:hypothetical protein PLICRDRAFT_109402 [Plicaturopsis crispa FD-325 SS-3]|nr:hypothetical protein PLICRDRAFT_109402 [Plicaturopsis crispa FD-325 SS-3]
MEQLDECKGLHKIKYHAEDEWDFSVEVTHKPIDLSLVMPHYRARYQPVEHRMGIFIGSETGPVKVKVCRPLMRARFYLDVQAATSDVTVWLPSDFRGHIHHSGKAVFSDGFINRIMHNVQLNEEIYADDELFDEVVVATSGRIMFRMWDTNTSAPENRHRETWKRMFGCVRRAPETAVDWDFLLED